MHFLSGLEPLLKTYWYIALPVSLVFIVQMILTFTGTDPADGLDADFDGDLGHADGPFQLFTFRNLINFLLGFSWTGIAFYRSISSTAWLITLSVVVGALFVFAFFFIIRKIQLLEEDNTASHESLLNSSAEVYLTIPANEAGKGKILVSIKGSVRELDALTKHEKIETGQPVVITGVEKNGLIYVEKKS